MKPDGVRTNTQDRWLWRTTLRPARAIAAIRVVRKHHDRRDGRPRATLEEPVVDLGDRDVDCVPASRCGRRGQNASHALCRDADAMAWATAAARARGNLKLHPERVELRDGEQRRGLGNALADRRLRAKLSRHRSAIVRWATTSRAAAVPRPRVGHTQAGICSPFSSVARAYSASARVVCTFPFPQ